jgi:hypothetical protein
VVSGQVVLADGTVVRAKQVLSNATPAVTFLVINSQLPSHVILVASIHSDVSTLLVSSTEGVLMRWSMMRISCDVIYSLCRPPYVFSLDACLYRDMLKWNEAYPHKLIAAWMRIQLTFLIRYVSWVQANIINESPNCFQKNSACRFYIMVCLKFLADYYLLIYTHCQELMKSAGSHGSVSLQFVMTVMVWNFVGNSHKVMTAISVMLPSNCCWGDFSAISYICDVAEADAWWYPSWQVYDWSQMYRLQICMLPYLTLVIARNQSSSWAGVRVNSAILCDYGPATYAWFAKTGQLWRHLRCYFGQSIFHRESLWFVWVGGWMKLKPWPIACCSGLTSQPATALDSEPCVLLFEPRSKLVNSMDACPGWHCCWFIDAFLGMSWD